MPNSNACIPTGTCKELLVDVVPVDAEHLSGVLGPIPDGMLLQCTIPELDRSVTRGGDQLIFMSLGEGEIVKTVLSVEYLFDGERRRT